MKDNGYSIVGPAMREGKLDYDLIDYSQRFIMACRNAVRIGELCNFSCVAIRRSVFEKIGLFDDRFFVVCNIMRRSPRRKGYFLRVKNTRIMSMRSLKGFARAIQE